MVAVMPQNNTGLSAQRVLVRLETALSEEALAHTARVHEQLASEIRDAGGWISFEHYMETALYAPGLGYYSAGARKLGPGGDFTTAPESSRLFGACVAQQCAEVLDSLTDASILEIGAGSGALAADVLSRLDSLGRLPARYLILEVSADLRERQRRALKERIPHLQRRVDWLDAPPTEAFDGVILANEVLDALPVRRFRWHPTHCEELGVAIAGHRLVWAPRTASAELTQVCRVLEATAGGWQDGYVSEYCQRLPAWTLAVTQALRSGMALWIDYGLPRRQYYFQQRRDGTLICHFRQRANEDPFIYPGLQDISAWVDFTLLAESCVLAGFALAGFATQAHFLAALNVDREMQHLAGTDQTRFLRLAEEARRLMLPGEMGERFKAMAWLRGWDAPLRGFALQDLRHSL